MTDTEKEDVEELLIGVLEERDKETSIWALVMNMTYRWDRDYAQGIRNDMLLAAKEVLDYG